VRPFVAPDHPRLRGENHDWRRPAYDAVRPPRSRGEGISSVSLCMLVTGSPPLARGRLLFGDAHGLAERTTPARAGRTAAGTGGRSPASEHPRSRGENGASGLQHRMICGTPPLAPGEPADDRRRAGRRGNTPACAGRTRSARISSSASTEHPRLRGENIPLRSAPPRRRGTPPLARGEPAVAGRPGRGQRNTPACAGRTRSRRFTVIRQPEHPRLRGENSCLAPVSSPTTGTPPLARGERPRALHGCREQRNTPACAGRTLLDLGL
jgi:hypothetical protein